MLNWVLKLNTHTHTHTQTHTHTHTHTHTQTQGTSNILTGYLQTYLESLCVNSSTLPQASCSNIVLIDVDIICEATNDKQGVLSATLQSYNAQEIAEVFERQGDTQLVDSIIIEPCGNGQCVDPPTDTPLTTVVIVLSLIIAVVFILAIVITVGVVCCLKHNRCCCKSR